MSYDGEANRDRGAGRRTLLLIATIVFAFLGVQVAIAGQGGSGAEKASHGKKHTKSSKRQLRRVRAELESLHEKVAALEARAGAPAGPTAPAIPTGTAGGDLTGSYPNPFIADGAVDASKLTTTIQRSGQFLATDGGFTTRAQTCNPGERLLSGGVRLAIPSVSDVQVTRDSPLASPGGGEWRVTVMNNPSGTGDVTFFIDVLCLEA